MAKSKQVPKAIDTINSLNRLIEANNEVYDKTDYILCYYKNINGEYPSLKLLDKEYLKLKRHFFKSLIFFDKLLVARTTLRKIGYSDYLKTM